MTLHELPHSPFCLAIRRVLDAAGVSYTAVEVPNHDRSALLLLTDGAYYQVPVLEHEGEIVTESGGDTQDVARWIDARFTQGRLFPAALEGHQAIFLPYMENEVEDVTFRLCDIHYIPSITDPAARGMIIRHKERKFGRGCVDAWREQRGALWNQALARLRPFELMLGHTPFVLGQAPVFADFLLFGLLQNLTWREWNPFPPCANLRMWHDRLATFRFS